MARIRMAQYGTKHGHAAGVLQVMLNNPDVEFMGVYEPDPQRRKELEHANGPFRHVRWYDRKEDMLGDSSIVAIASEGRNDESLAQTEEIIRAGKHVWYDKPAGDDWDHFQRIVALAREKGLIVQMGYMFRHHDGFQRIAHWVKSGLLGEIFGVRAHMSTWISEQARKVISVHKGGIFFDLAGHMIDQIVWLLGRPVKVTSFLRHDDTVVPGFEDNTLAVLEYPRAMAVVDIAAMETRPMARRFEVYGSLGSAIMEPFEPVRGIRLCLERPRDGFLKGEQFVLVEDRPRYVLSLVSFLAAVRGEQPPERSLDHELLVQETLLRATGHIPGG